MEQKRCIKCGEVKPLSEFYAHPNMADGHFSKCKDCVKADVKKHRAAHPERDLETRLKACAKNPNHKNASMAVDAAIRAGKLTRPVRCQGCGRRGSETRLSAHHYDYSEPLDVIWLCGACHRRVDHVRAYVESGKPWSDYRSEQQHAYNAVKRALEHYATAVRHRKPFVVADVLQTIGW